MIARIRLLAAAMVVVLATLVVGPWAQPVANAACTAWCPTQRRPAQQRFCQPWAGCSAGAEGFGGGDYQHVYPLPDGRVLWLFQDMFFSNDNNLRDPPTTPRTTPGSCRTARAGRCSAAEAVTASAMRNHCDSRRWFWPMDGEIGPDGNLWIFMVEMRNPTGRGAGRGRVPVGHWLARSTRSTLGSVLSFAPAPRTPVPGSTAGRSCRRDQYSYLYGHCYRQYVNTINSAGQFDSSCMPHTYLARVPLGRSMLAPEYWTASGWSTPTPPQPCRS